MISNQRAHSHLEFGPRPYRNPQWNAGDMTKKAAVSFDRKLSLIWERG